MAGAEGVAALSRFQARKDGFKKATDLAASLGRPLVVVGAPRGGAHTRLIEAYGCGDVCVDLVGCGSCPTSIQVDLATQRVGPVADDSAVVFVSCVLEYVPDVQSAWREILRMAGDPSRIVLVNVQPWSFTAALYPGARHTVAIVDGRLEASPVSTTRKVASLAGIGALAFTAAR